MRILVVNAGSSSLKIAAFAQPKGGELTCQYLGSAERAGEVRRARLKDATKAVLADSTWEASPGSSLHAEGLDWLIAAIEARDPGQHWSAIGHRVVHGGAKLIAPTRIDADLISQLQTLAPLAPLHMPANLLGIEACGKRYPDVPQIAFFDTAFHADQPWVASTYGLPREYYDLGIRRYGFHGLSYASIMHQLRRDHPTLANGRMAIAHLGSGASICGVWNGKPLGCTMGFSPLDGLPMGTRCGQLDPGVVIYMQMALGMSAEGVLKLLNSESGLQGLSGISSDMRELLASDHPHAKQAVDYFVHRAVMAVGSMTGVMDGFDNFVFTGGIGENSPVIRERICARFDWSGFLLDPERNARNATVISESISPVTILVLPAEEEAEIARAAVQFAGA